MLEEVQVPAKISTDRLKMALSQLSNMWVNKAIFEQKCLVQAASNQFSSISKVLKTNRRIKTRFSQDQPNQSKTNFKTPKTSKSLRLDSLYVSRAYCLEIRICVPTTDIRVAADARSIPISLPSIRETAVDALSIRTSLPVTRETAVDARFIQTSLLSK